MTEHNDEGRVPWWVAEGEPEPEPYPPEVTARLAAELAGEHGYQRTDHEARPDDLPEPGDRCKDCGQPITWIGPSQYDWEHVEQPVVPTPANMPTQSADGRPHLAYYRRDLLLSFVWSGEPGEAVEVCPGGYGEPVQDRFAPAYIEHYTGLKLTQVTDAPVLLAAFQQACDAWVADRERRRE